MKPDTAAPLILRIALAFGFAYAGIAAFLTPQNWIGFIPSFLRALIDGDLLLHIHSLFNLLLALWLLSGKKLFYSSLISALALLIITLSNIGAMDIVFRDISLLLAALALAVLSYGKEK